MTDFTETVGSYMQRAEPDVLALYDALVLFRKTGDHTHLADGEMRLHKIADAFRAVDDLHLSELAEDLKALPKLS